MLCLIFGLPCFMCLDLPWLCFTFTLFDSVMQSLCPLLTSPYRSLSWPPLHLVLHNCFAFALHRLFPILILLSPPYPCLTFEVPFHCLVFALTLLCPIFCLPGLPCIYIVMPIPTLPSPFLIFSLPSSLALPCLFFDLSCLCLAWIRSFLTSPCLPLHYLAFSLSLTCFAFATALSLPCIALLCLNFPCIASTCVSFTLLWFSLLCTPLL